MSRFTDLESAGRRLGDALRPADRRPGVSTPSPVRRRKALVIARDDAAATADLLIGQATVADVPYLAGLTPMVGDVAWTDNVDGALALTDVYPRGWTPMPMVNGSTNWGGRAETAACRPMGDRRVIMRGIITLAAGGVGIGQVTIPTGFTPAVDQWIPCAHFTGAAYATGLVKISVGFSQIIVIAGTGANLLYLDGVAWTLD